MKVFILTEGGKKIGSGHLARTGALYDALEEKDLKPIFIARSDESTDWLLAGKRHMSFDWVRDDRRLFDIIEGADLVIVDSYMAPAGMYKKISGMVGKAAYIDDCKRIDYPPGIVINGLLSASSLKYPKIRGVSYVLGAKYAIVRKEFQKIPAKKIRGPIRSIMITFGSFDLHNMSSKILEYLCQAYPKMAKNVIIGRGFCGLRSIERMKGGKADLVYYPDADSMKQVMMRSDIAISAGGQTLYELARAGVPTIGICTSDNQEANLVYWQKSGLLEYIGWWNDKGLTVALGRSISNVLCPVSQRTKRSLKARRYIDGNGAGRVASLLYRACLEAR